MNKGLMNKGAKWRAAAFVPRPNSDLHSTISTNKSANTVRFPPPPAMVHVKGGNKYELISEIGGQKVRFPPFSYPCVCSLYQ